MIVSRSLPAEAAVSDRAVVDLAAVSRFIRLNGRSVKYRLSDLQQWVESQPRGGAGVNQKRGRGRPRRIVSL